MNVIRNSVIEKTFLSLVTTPVTEASWLLIAELYRTCIQNAVGVSES